MVDRLHRLRRENNGQFARGRLAVSPTKMGAVPAPRQAAAHPVADAPAVVSAAPVVSPTAAMFDRFKAMPAVATVPVETPADSPESYDTQVRAYEAAGMPTSDAQAAVDAAYGQAADREEAARTARQDVQTSFDRSDTDGFVSQWASGVTAQQHELEAEVLARGGTWDFPVLTRDGALVPARIIETKFGAKWAVFASAADAQKQSGEITGWVALGDKALARKDYVQQVQVRPAKVVLQGETATSVRPVVIPADGMKFSPDAPRLPRAHT